MPRVRLYARIGRLTSTSPRSSGNDRAGDPTQILFPHFFESAWLAAGKTDLEKARMFLFAYSGKNEAVNKELWRIAMNPNLTDVASLATAVKDNVFGNRHRGFIPCPLMQWMRFVLIKSCEVGGSEKTKQVHDFYFDPTIAATIDKLSWKEDTVSYEYPAAPFKVAIIGGGPTGLATAIALAEKCGAKVEVHVYEGRWAKQDGSVVDYPQGARRRDQVVTLQHSVTDLLSEKTRQALFLGYPEEVWPTSANLQIRKVEDRLLWRAQDPEFRDTIHLHPQSVTRETLESIGDFHLLAGADGAGSWVRQTYFVDEEEERGQSHALGIAFSRPNGLPFPQPLNIFLTLCQTRYLLNASDRDGTGFLNMQLTEDEWNQLVTVDGQPCTFGRPACLRSWRVPAGFETGQVFAPSEDKNNPLWRAISDGLKLFGFVEAEVTGIMRIPIVVRGIRRAVARLDRVETSAMKRPGGLVAVVGDAAMTVHFWPGRGANSGIKSGVALADEVAYALANGRLVGLKPEGLQHYSDFLEKLQSREHDTRSLPIINQSGDPKLMGWLMSNAKLVPYNLALDWIVNSTRDIARRLQERNDWPFKPMTDVEGHLRYVLGQLTPATIQEMAVTWPWPTREMAGSEVLPRCSLSVAQGQKSLFRRNTTRVREKLRVFERSRLRDDKKRTSIGSSLNAYSMLALPRNVLVDTNIFAPS